MQSTSARADGAGLIQRRHLRRRVRIEAELRIARVRYRVTVLDLSAGGYRVECIHRIGPAQRAMLKLDGFEPMGGNIVWADGNVAGCALDRPLHPSVAETLAARYPENA